MQMVRSEIKSIRSYVRTHKGQSYDPETKKCAAEYVYSLNNPFDLGVAPCIPVGFGVRSRKFYTVSRVLMNTSSTTGVGFVFGRPAVANDGLLLSHTSADYAGTTSTGLAVSGTGIYRTNPTSPFASAAFGTSGTAAKCRCVSAGMRIKYVGTKLNEGGRIVAYSAADNSSLVGVTFDQMMTYPRATISTVKSGVWSDVIYIPQDNNSLEWLAGADSPNGNPFMAIAVSSAVVNQPFMAEFISHWEVIGPSVGEVTNNPPGSEGLTSSIVGSLSNHNASAYSPSTLVGIIAAIPQIAMLAVEVRRLTLGSGLPHPMTSLHGV